MAKIRTEDIGEFYHHYPRVATVVTVKAGEEENALAIAWHCPLSFDPPLYGVSISPKRFSYKLILKAKEFAVNFLPTEKIDIVAAVGRTSGREIEKFERFSILKESPSKIKSPILKDAYAAYECSLVDHLSLGDHEWFVGKVVAVHFLEGAFLKEGVLNLDVIKPALYLGADRYLEITKGAIHHLTREDVLRSK